MKTAPSKQTLTNNGITVMVAALSLSATAVLADVQITVGHAAGDAASTEFTLKDLPAPSKNDAAAAAEFTVVDGRPDGNGGGVAMLNNGRMPGTPDDPAGNFFFGAGTDGGRLVVDLGRPVEIKEVNTYSWHPTTRGPQVYKLYASKGGGFTERPARPSDPTTCGWEWIADVNTRAQAGESGGQYGVSISDSDGTLGSYQYLLFDIVPTETDNAFGNTFYSEIDVVDANGPAPVAAVSPAFVIPSADGSCQITIDTSAASQLSEWAEQTLAPVLAEWYPKIVAMLPGDGFEPPIKFSVTFKPDNGVAYTSGNRIVANSNWIERELDGEALGAIVHEVVHVVQQYRGRPQPGAQRPPHFLGEGIPDYIRFFLYEPQSHGADLVWLRNRRTDNLDYQAGYRISANFLNYVIENYAADQDLIAALNAACREGRYKDELWVELTGKSVEDLSQEWMAATREQLARRAGKNANVLSEAEEAAGWKLLFNGQDFSGWSNFKSSSVRPGWQVQEGALVCADPHDAGDLVTAEPFGAFELELDYNISEGGNSGIIYHVTDEGGAVWATGPEFQLEDNAKAADPQRCGWLYALYQPPIDPLTGKPIDATLPAGEWNHIRLVISPEKCEHWINDVKYFEYVIDSEDFKERVAKSKFSRMPLFAKSDSGYIALQGDHGQISFRNIKVRELPANGTNPKP